MGQCVLHCVYDSWQSLVRLAGKDLSHSGCMYTECVRREGCLLLIHMGNN